MQPTTGLLTCSTVPTQFLFTLKACCAKEKFADLAKRNKLCRQHNKLFETGSSVVVTWWWITWRTTKSSNSMFPNFYVFFSTQLFSLFSIDEFLCGIKLKGHQEVTATRYWPLFPAARDSQQTHSSANCIHFMFNKCGRPNLITVHIQTNIERTGFRL